MLTWRVGHRSEISNFMCHLFCMKFEKVYCISKDIQIFNS